MSSPTIPTAFICPISQDIMEDPVILIETGATYERKEILKWLSNHHTDPLTNEVLKNKSIIPNRALRTAIEESNIVTKASLVPTPPSLPLPPPQPQPPVSKTNRAALGSVIDSNKEELFSTSIMPRRSQEHDYQSNHAIALPPSAPVEPSASSNILRYRDLRQAINTKELCAVGCSQCKKYKAIGENALYFSCYCISCHKTWEKDVNDINRYGRQPHNTKQRCDADCAICAKYTNTACYCYVCHKTWKEKKVPLPALKRENTEDRSHNLSGESSSNKKRCVIS